MNVDDTINELKSLIVPERLKVVATVLDSPDETTPVHLSPEQQAELDRRLDAYEANPEDTLTWDP